MWSRVWLGKFWSYLCISYTWAMIWVRIVPRNTYPLATLEGHVAETLFGVENVLLGSLELAAVRPIRFANSPLQVAVDDHLLVRRHDLRLGHDCVVLLLLECHVVNGW